MSVKKFPGWVFVCMMLLFQHCAEQKQFTEMEAGATGISFRNDITENQHTNIMTYEYTYNGGGIAAGDLNNDGLTDLYFSGNSVPNKLYLNKGGWKFEDITAQAGIAGRSDWKTGVTMADVNGDGWLDLYVCYSGNAPGEGFNKPVIRNHPKRANQLFINGGCEKGGVPRFSEQAKAFGLDAPGTFSTQAYFFDYDRDGDLDMFLLNHANMFYSAFFNVKRLRNLRHPYFGNKLYRNDGNNYTEVSENAGIHGSGLNFGLSASVSDINGDHWPDIYVTNDYEEQDFCYINKRDGTFREVSHTIFAHLSKYGMGSDVADVNNDGLLDIFVADMLPEDNHRQKLLKGPDEYDKYSRAVDSGYHHQYMRNTLQLNRGFKVDTLPRFSEVGQLAGISNTDWSWAPLFMDIDNDGLKDLFITNGYLRDFTNLDFTKYIVNDAVNQANINNHPVNMLALVQKMPSTKLANYVFRNTDGIHFNNVSEAWGVTYKSVSNAAVYADLDNDGDLDLVAGNLNDEVTVLQNLQERIQKNNYIKLKLKGKTPNTFGIGAKVWVSLEGKELFQEANFTRGYQSTVEPILTIGIGKDPVVKAVKVLWPDSSVSVIENVSTNQTLTIDQEKASTVPVHAEKMPEAILTDITAGSGLEFTHRENPYVDFKYQRLAPYQFSKLGGKLAVGDVNNDGNDDVFFGGAAGRPGQLFLGSDDGTFRPGLSDPWEKDRAFEDLEAAFVDADRDGDADLYVVSGGNEYPAGDPNYQDRLYRNDGRGSFERVAGALPSEASSGGCAITSDFDKDGDQDVFVGGRLVPQHYPDAPESFLLRNDAVKGTMKFTNVTMEVNPGLKNAGMITDAAWADVNNDTWLDLIIVGEWMPVRIFLNEKGKTFKEITTTRELANSHGWWSRIAAADVDNDGDTDFLLGNAGTNLQLRASEKEPMLCYSQDINNDGDADPILCYYIQGKSYPLPSRDELLEQVTPLRKKFVKYADYADATMEDIIGEDQMAKSRVLKVETLRSSWLENSGDGKFQLKPLPSMAQSSMINGFVHDDFDGDGDNEVLAAGNFFPYRAQLGRSDASSGVFMKFSQGNATVYRDQSSPWLTGDIRDMAVLKFRNAPKRIVVSRNNAPAGVFQYKNNHPSEISHAAR